jgi:4-amino-4-deoxy-L-arabinose transferase-like glycosyltransferase
MIQNNLFKISNKHYWGLMFLFTLVYVKGLFNIIYGIDANRYAVISKGILESGEWLHLYIKGVDYLDKPPLHFWLSAVSFKFFGINNFAYKLPSFLFTILGAYSTFKLGKLLYSKNVGKLAALLFYSCFSIIMINQDVRTDTILVGTTIFSVWQLVAYLRTNKTSNFILAFIAIGMAMLVKGPIGIMIPVLALGTEFLIKKEWSNIFKWQWIIGLIIVAIVISPMVYGLYTQFNLQPTKEFNLSSGIPVKGISGLKFYFWDQSFGRITGGNKEWENDSSPFFFTHTYLWSFLPWSFIGLFALVLCIKYSFKNIAKSEFINIGAIVLPFITFSMSSYKLPHYIYVCFPFWFIITANYIAKLYESPKKPWLNINYYVQVSLVGLTILASLLVVVYVFPTVSILIWSAIILFMVLIIYTLIKFSKINKIIYTSGLSILLVAFVFNFHFIPTISIYDAPSQAAEFSKELTINNVYSNSEHSIAFDIYANNDIVLTDIYFLQDKVNNNNYIFVNGRTYQKIKDVYIFKNIYTFKHKGLTSLTIPFLNPKTRAKRLREYYLLEI